LADAVKLPGYCTVWHVGEVIAIFRSDPPSNRQLASTRIRHRMSIRPDQWSQITALFDAVRQLPPAERADALRAGSADDDEIRAEVEALLAADTDDDFLAPDSRGPFAPPERTISPLIGRTLGPWRVEREIGRGGMGVVYAGQHVDGQFAKHVAIKTLAIGVDRPELLWRFQREREILAGLEHPNIAALFDGGTTDDGVPYLVMEYVSGNRIDAWCDTHQLSVPQRLDLFRQVCAAVHYAHTKLIVHRDLKPNNIFVTHDGIVKLLDFGVAKLLDAKDSRQETTFGVAAPLTVAYASPEQLRGDDVTTSADVYSLGVVLFKLLTGALPFEIEGRNAAQVQQLVSTQAPRTPSDVVTLTHPGQCGVPTTSALRDTLRGELDAIVLMALRAERDRRYPSADALSADLLRYLKGLPVQAKPDTLGYRARKFVRRQRALVAGVAIAAAALIAGTISATRAANVARAEAAQTRRVARVLQEMIGAGASEKYRAVPTLLTALDSARSAVAVEFAADPTARADLYEVFAASYFNFARSDLALLMVDSARVLNERTRGPASLAVARDLMGSADPLFALGQLDSSMARQRRAIQLLRAIRPVPNAELADAELELSFNEIALLQSDSALPRMASALERSRREAHPHWDRIAMGEAVTILPLFNQKRVAAADSAFARSEAALAHDSSASQLARTALAFQGQSLMIRGRAAEAESRVRRLLTLTASRLGPDHYLTAQAQNLLARVMMQLGRFSEGRGLIDSAIATNEATTAHDPMYLGEMYITRSGFEMRLHDWTAAKRSIALATSQRDRLGVQRPILNVSILYTTAALLEERGDVEQARAMFVRAAADAHANLAAGAKNVGLADAKRAAFEARHPIQTNASRAR
jgi:eukaryotic-like serine/threonine-protein kinase